jgi:hypothetical protein
MTRLDVDAGFPHANSGRRCWGKCLACLAVALCLAAVVAGCTSSQSADGRGATALGRAARRSADIGSRTRIGSSVRLRVGARRQARLARREARRFAHQAGRSFATFREGVYAPARRGTLRGAEPGAGAAAASSSAALRAATEKAAHAPQLVELLPQLRALARRLTGISNALEHGRVRRTEILAANSIIAVIEQEAAALGIRLPQPKLR